MHLKENLPVTAKLDLKSLSTQYPSIHLNGNQKPVQVWSLQIPSVLLEPKLDFQFVNNFPNFVDLVRTSQLVVYNPGIWCQHPCEILADFENKILTFLVKTLL